MRLSLRCRIRTLVRRSTKRCVSRSCRASLSRSSMSRVFSRQCAGSSSQFLRLATKVQVRIWLDPVDQRVDVAARYCRRSAPARQSSRRRRAPWRARSRIDAGDDLAVLGRRDVAIVRDLAAFPQQLAAASRPTARPPASLRASELRAPAGRWRSARGSGPGRSASRRGWLAGASMRGEVELGVAPLQHLAPARNRGSRARRPVPRRRHRHCR